MEPVGNRDDGVLADRELPLLTLLDGDPSMGVVEPLAEVPHSELPTRVVEASIKRKEKGALWR